MKFIHSALAAITLLLASAGAATAQNVGYQWPDGSEYRSLVFNKGDFNSNFYRIPAITTLADGTLVAVADKRIEYLSDLPGKIDVVARRSTDGGRTWSDYVTVAEHDEYGGYGDPAIVYDRRTGDILVISLHGKGLWGDEPGKIAMSRSRDGGLTWEAPVTISDAIYSADPAGSQPIKCNGAFASSGGALQLKNGRLMFVLVTRQNGVGGFPCYAIFSDDGGRTWKASKTPATLNGDEAKVTQLADGSVMMSIRSRGAGPRKFSLSKDNGNTWTELTEGFDKLHDVACNGDFIHYTHGGRDVLLQSLPAGPWRSNITIYASEDGGRTWSDGYRVSAGPGAYSAMTVMPDGAIGILTEEGVHDVDATHQGGYRIWFTKVPIAKILK